MKDTVGNIAFGYRLKGTLKVEKGDYLGKKFSLLERECIVMGRQADTITLKVSDNMGVSRKHFLIYAGINKEIYGEDLLSTNKSFVNGKEVEGYVPLKEGDLLILGRDNGKSLLEIRIESLSVDKSKVGYYEFESSEVFKIILKLEERTKYPAVFRNLIKCLNPNFPQASYGEEASSFQGIVNHTLSSRKKGRVGLSLESRSDNGLSDGELFRRELTKRYHLKELEKPEVEKESSQEGLLVVISCNDRGDIQGFDYFRRGREEIIFRIEPDKKTLEGISFPLAPLEPENFKPEEPKYRHSSLCRKTLGHLIGLKLGE